MKSSLFGCFILLGFLLLLLLLLVCLGVISSNAKVLLRALYSGIIPSRAEGTIWSMRNRIWVDYMQGKCHSSCSPYFFSDFSSVLYYMTVSLPAD